MKFQTQGLVIREKAVGERGWFVTLLTRDAGLIQAFVNRTRGKRENRLPGTDLLGYSRLDIYKGRDKYIISRPCTSASWQGICWSPARTRERPCG